MTVTQLTTDGLPSQERVVDGIRMVTQAFTGAEVGDVFSIYLPGTSQSLVPEEYFTWVRSNVSGGALMNAGLYNQTKELGFVLE